MKIIDVQVNPLTLPILPERIGTIGVIFLTCKYRFSEKRATVPAHQALQFGYENSKSIVL